MRDFDSDACESKIPNQKAEKTLRRKKSRTFRDTNKDGSRRIRNARKKDTRQSKYYAEGGTRSDEDDGNKHSRNKEEGNKDSISTKGESHIIPDKTSTDRRKEARSTPTKTTVTELKKQLQQLQLVKSYDVTVAAPLSSSRVS